MSFTAPIGSRHASAEAPVSVAFVRRDRTPQRLINHGIPSPVVERRISTPFSPRDARSCLYGQFSSPSASVPSPLHIGRQLRQPLQKGISLVSCPQVTEAKALQGQTAQSSASGQIMPSSNDLARRPCGYPVVAMTTHASRASQPSPLSRSLPHQTVPRQVSDPTRRFAQMHGSIEAPCQRERSQVSQTQRPVIFPQPSSPQHFGRAMSPRKEGISPLVRQIGSGVATSLQSKSPSPVRDRLENSPRDSVLQQHSARNFTYLGSQGNVLGHQFASPEKRLVNGSITTKSPVIGSAKTETLIGQVPSCAGHMIQSSPRSPVLRSPRLNYNSNVVSPRLVSSVTSCQNKHVGEREVESTFARQSADIVDKRKKSFETDLVKMISEAEAKVAVSQDQRIRSCSNYSYSSDSSATFGQCEETVAEAPTLESHDVVKTPCEDYSLVDEGREPLDDENDMDSCPSLELLEMSVEHLQVGDNVLACFEENTWLEAEISLIMADGTILVNWSDGCPNNRIKTIGEIRYKPVTLFHLGVAPRQASRLSRPNSYATKLRTEGDSQIWVRKRMPQVVESQSFQYMFRIVFLMSQCPFFSNFMEAFLAACNAEPHDERSRVLVPCDDGEVASLALQQLCPVAAMSELQRKATKNIPLKDQVPEDQWVRPASMRARSFSISGRGLPEFSDASSAESTMLMYMVRTNCDESLAQTHFETIRLLEDMYASRVVSDFVPRRMILVFEEAGHDSKLDVVELLQTKGLTELETMQIPLPLNNEDTLRELARYIAETMVAQNPESQLARDLPSRDVPSRGRLGSALGGTSLVV